MARRVIDRERRAVRGPWLAGSLVLLLGALVLFGTGHDFGALTALIGAFLAVAVAKRAG
ncbi:MAG TPA: hypothetical protein VFQ85_02300 [Mycobacteriales bacterium]|jgi:hypothetical protein|nr:hypothetical protein [Mycobacteriales bacterium]